MADHDAERWRVRPEFGPAACTCPDDYDDDFGGFALCDKGEVFVPCDIIGCVSPCESAGPCACPLHFAGRAHDASHRPQDL